jgi:serine phosphatase RsbU (regulator of sigma subunit)
MQCVERYCEPVEILTRLEAMLSSIFDQSQDAARSALTDFAFAAIDTVTGDVRYARTGAYPKVVVVSSSGVVASEKMITVKGRRTPISEGRARLVPGDHVVLFTDGIGRRLAAGNRRPEETAASLISRTPHHQSTGDLCKRFFSATRASLDPDDLTLVVIRIDALATQQETAALGVVA